MSPPGQHYRYSLGGAEKVASVAGGIGTFFRSPNRNRSVHTARRFQIFRNDIGLFAVMSLRGGSLTAAGTSLPEVRCDMGFGAAPLVCRSGLLTLVHSSVPHALVRSGLGDSADAIAPSPSSLASQKLLAAGVSALISRYPALSAIERLQLDWMGRKIGDPGKKTWRVA